MTSSCNIRVWKQNGAKYRTEDRYSLRSLNMAIFKSIEAKRSGGLNNFIALKFDRCLRSCAVDRPVKFQSDQTVVNQNIAVSRRCEILRWNTGSLFLVWSYWGMWENAEYVPALVSITSHTLQLWSAKLKTIFTTTRHELPNAQTHTLHVKSHWRNTHLVSYVY